MSNVSTASILYDSAGTEKGTVANPVRTNPTGATAQPVTDGGGSITIDAVSLPLPVGAATEATLATRASEATLATRASEATLATRASEATLATRVAEATFTGRVGEVQASPTANTVLGRLKDLYDAIVARWNTLGQKTMANSAPVVIASDQSPVKVRGPDAHGAAPTESPVLAAGIDGVNVRRLLTDQSGRLLTREFDEPTFVIAASNVVVGSGKSLLSIVNTGSSVLRVREVRIANSQTSAVTGVAGEFHLRRITGHSGGSDLSSTPGFLAHDTADAVPAGLTARTGATVSGESASPLAQRRWSTDEWGPGTLDVEAHDHAIQNALPFYRSDRPMKPITLRANQGISVRFQTASTAGAFDVEIVVSEGVL